MCSFKTCMLMQSNDHGVPHPHPTPLVHKSAIWCGVATGMMLLKTGDRLHLTQEEWK